jgi:hypothetical protein
MNHKNLFINQTSLNSFLTPLNLCLIFLTLLFIQSFCFAYIFNLEHETNKAVFQALNQNLIQLEESFRIINQQIIIISKPAIELGKNAIDSGLYSGDNCILRALTSKPVLYTLGIVLAIVAVYFGVQAFQKGKTDPSEGGGKTDPSEGGGKADFSDSGSKADPSPVSTDFNINKELDAGLCENISISTDHLGNLSESLGTSAKLLNNINENICVNASRISDISGHLGGINNDLAIAADSLIKIESHMSKVHPDTLIGLSKLSTIRVTLANLDNQLKDSLEIISKKFDAIAYLLHKNITLEQNLPPYSGSSSPGLDAAAASLDPSPILDAAAASLDPNAIVEGASALFTAASTII